jgi:hypothetical protein
MRNYPVTTGPAWRAIGLSCLLLALCGFCSSIHAQSIFERRAVQRSGSVPRTPSPTLNNEPTAALGQTRGKTVPGGVSTPILDVTSALGQALAGCDKDVAVQDSFVLPSLKGELTLDRCYKGRAHFVCVSTALIAEAQSLTKSFGE